MSLPPSGRPRRRPRSKVGSGEPRRHAFDAIVSGKVGEPAMPDAIDDLFRRFGKAFNKADVDEIAACVTDDFEWRLNSGGAPAGRVLKGKDDLRAYFNDKSKAHREARYSEARIHRAG